MLTEIRVVENTTDVVGYKRAVLVELKLHFATNTKHFQATSLAG